MNEAENLLERVDERADDLEEQFQQEHSLPQTQIKRGNEYSKKDSSFD